MGGSAAWLFLPQSGPCVKGGTCVRHVQGGQNGSKGCKECVLCTMGVVGGDRASALPDLVQLNVEKHNRFNNRAPAVPVLLAELFHVTL